MKEFDDLDAPRPRDGAGEDGCVVTTVMCTVNGEARPVSVRKRPVAGHAAVPERADSTDHRQVAAPFAGVVTPVVAVGDTVASGDVVATIEAMKLEAAITAPLAGTVTRVVVDGTVQVDGGDLVLVL